MLNQDSFFVRFHRGEKVVYGGGQWSKRIDLDNFKATDGEISILPLEYEQSQPWPEISGDIHPVTILGIAQWRQFRNRLFASLLPADRSQGLVLNFRDDDYFIYRDESRLFKAVLLQQKPAGLTVGDTISSSQLVRKGLPILEGLLKENHIEAERIAFNTGDTGPYSLPFIYINTKRLITVFIRLEPNPSAYAKSSKALAVMRTAFHVVKSHLTGIVTHPITSIYRLFFVGTDTLTEVMRPDWLVAMENREPPPLANAQAMDLASWETTLDQLTQRRSSTGTIDYLLDGKAFFTRFADAVSSAQQSIDLRMYIFDDDDYAIKIADMLKRRSNEGVDVRVLLDGLGTVVSSLEVQSSLPESHIAPFSMKQYLEKDSKVKVRLTDNPWMTGDHIKTVTVDGGSAFMGGMNIAREYRFDWHDMMVELKGAIVTQVKNEFDKAWIHAGFLGELGYLFYKPNSSKQTDTNSYPIRLLFTHLHDAQIFRLQRAAIQNSRRYIYVENPYFTDDAMLHDLVKARHRGVDVRVIVPLVTDRGPITRNNILTANIMLNHGIRVFIYPGMSHVKAAIFDGWACLGSANWDRWSLQINKEMNIATSHTQAVASLKTALFEKDFAASVEATDPFPVNWQDHLIEKFGDYFF